MEYNTTALATNAGNKYKGKVRAAEFESVGVVRFELKLELESETDSFQWIIFFGRMDIRLLANVEILTVLEELTEHVTHIKSNI